MNCDQFARRMHDCLDHRVSLDRDLDLSQHADQCESCRAQLDAWRQIATIMPGGAHRRRHPTAHMPSARAWLTTAAGLAAAVCLALLIVARGDRDADAPIVTDAAVTQEHPAVLAQATGEMDPARWWRSVQDRDWVGQTMPAVRSVREGVAPLGRSLMRAVTILTIGGRDQTS